MKNSSRKPKLTLIEPGSTDREPGSTVRDSQGTRLWRKVLRENPLNAAQREILKRACVATDEADALRKKIAVDGEVIYSDGKPLKAHPAIRVELALRRFAVKTLNDLLRDQRPKRPVGRPPLGGIGITYEQLRRSRGELD